MFPTSPLRGCILFRIGYICNSKMLARQLSSSGMEQVAQSSSGKGRSAFANGTHARSACHSRVTNPILPST